MPSTNCKNIGPLIINIDNTRLSDNERSIIKHKLIGGVILFTHNYSSKNQLTALIDELKSIKDNLLITIDHEGGRIQRLIDNFTHLPSFEHISQIKNNKLKYDVAYSSGYIAGHELSEIGFDINFSPVVDLNHDKDNKLLKDRTFGNNPVDVIELANKYIIGCLSGGILPVLKHYPGHGRVTTDSHIENCVSDVTFNELIDTDIKPFQELVKNHQIPIMTNHVIYKEIDNYITTYSKKLLQEKIKTIFPTNSKICFISDDLEMHSAKFINGIEVTCEERVLLALNAGCRFIIATTMQNNMLIKQNLSYKYFLENYLTKNIIEHYEKNHDMMCDIVLAKKDLKHIDKYKISLENITKKYE